MRVRVALHPAIVDGAERAVVVLEFAEPVDEVVRPVPGLVVDE